MNTRNQFYVGRDYEYRYSIGVAREWSIMTTTKYVLGLSSTCWRYGTAYEYGMMPPRYPVPAIRQGFEWGTNLRDGSTVLLEWRQESYEG